MAKKDKQRVTNSAGSPDKEGIDHLYDSEVQDEDIGLKRLKWTRSRIFLLWIGLITFIVIVALTGLDKKIAAAVLILIGLITPVFTGVFSALGQLINMIPYFGPAIVKAFTLPATLLIALSAYILSLIRIKQGMFKQVVSARIYALVLAIGIVIGYILGKIL